MKWLMGLAAGLLFSATVAHAQSADTILTNGKILTVDGKFSVDGENLAVRENSVGALPMRYRCRKQQARSKPHQPLHVCFLPRQRVYPVPSVPIRC